MVWEHIRSKTDIYTSITNDSIFSKILFSNTASIHIIDSEINRRGIKYCEPVDLGDEYEFSRCCREGRFDVETYIDEFEDD